MVLHVFTSLLGGVLLCIPYGLHSETSVGGTTWITLGGYPSRVLSLGPYTLIWIRTLSGSSFFIGSVPQLFS